jgi:uncharacterized membrane protein (GlpM family)
MLDWMFLVGLFFKIVLTSGIVVSASLAVERSGPLLGALIASLPTAAAAAYIILAIEHDEQFLATSAVGSLLASASTAIFSLIYMFLAQRQSVLPSLGGALLVWLASAMALRQYAWTMPGVIILNLVVFSFTIIASAPYRRSRGPLRAVERAKYDLVWRAATVTAFVVVVTSLSYTLGPFLSGLFAAFPIAMSSYAAILHPRVGGPASASVYAHAQIPLVGFAIAFVVMHYTIVSIGTWWALLLHLSICLAWNAGLWLLREHSVRKLA